MASGGTALSAEDTPFTKMECISCGFTRPEGSPQDVWEAIDCAIIVSPGFVQHQGSTIDFSGAIADFDDD